MVSTYEFIIYVSIAEFGITLMCVYNTETDGSFFAETTSANCGSTAFRVPCFQCGGLFYWLYLTKKTTSSSTFIPSGFIVFGFMILIANSELYFPSCIVMNQGIVVEKLTMGCQKWRYCILLQTEERLRVATRRRNWSERPPVIL